MISLVAYTYRPYIVRADCLHSAGRPHSKLTLENIAPLYWLEEGIRLMDHSCSELKHHVTSSAARYIFCSSRQTQIVVHCNNRDSQSLLEMVRKRGRVEALLDENQYLTTEPGC